MDENATPTTGAPARCRDCARTLRNPRSIALGYGPTCQRKRIARLSAAAYEIALTGDYTDDQLRKAVTLIADAAIVHRTRALYLTASSRGDATYQVDTGTGGCTCPAGRHGRRCYHLAAAQILAAA